jgi:hypothetical protein
VNILLWVSEKLIFGSFPRFSVLPGLSLDGPLYVEAQKGSYDTCAFCHFIHELLQEMNPFPLKNSVVVMDNCSIHKHPSIKDLIERRYASQISSAAPGDPQLVSGGAS